MATYYSDKVVLGGETGLTNTVQAKYIETGDVPVCATVTFATAVTLAAGDTIQLLDVPGLCRVTSVQIDTGKIDGGATLTMNIGDAALPNRYFTATNIGQAGGYQAQNQGGILGYTFPAPTRIYATVVAGAASALTPTKLFVFEITYGADV